MTYQSVNLSDGKVLKTFPELSDSQLETAIATAATCFKTWREKTYAERATVVAKAAHILRERGDVFARHAALEMGKRIGEARGELGDMGIQEFVNRTLVRVASMEAPV